MRYFFNKETGDVVGFSNDTMKLTVLTEIGFDMANPVPPSRTVEAVEKAKKPRKAKGLVRFTQNGSHKGGHKCRICGGVGHNSKTCKQVTPPKLGLPEAETPALKVTLNPAKLAKVKNMLGDGEPMAFIATECGVSEETVEKIAFSLGL